MHQYILSRPAFAIVLLAAGLLHGESLLPDVFASRADAPTNLQLPESPGMEPNWFALAEEPTSTPATSQRQTEKLDPSAGSTKTTLPISTPAAATQPEASSARAGEFPTIGGTYGLDEFINHFAPHEPMYFVGGWKAPNVKFQLSIRYRLISPDGPLATKYPFFKGFNFAYSQTSLWDLQNTENPFFYDSSYRPEAFYYLENVSGLPKGWQFGVQAGAGHESNGQKDPNHRSLNIAYIRPILSIGGSSDALFFTLAPKFYDYIGSLSLNRDLPRYRGYCDLRFVVGQRDGVQLATIGRVGSHFDRGSVQLDLTYPLTRLFHGNVDLSLDAQYFLGYGDTLLTYNQRSNILRFGLALVR
jgi:outer membrane phospholipase A